MKQLFITLLLVVIAIPATSQICKRGLSLNKDVVTLTIDRNTTAETIGLYQKELKRFNIEIKLFEPKFTLMANFHLQHCLLIAMTVLPALRQALFKLQRISLDFTGYTLKELDTPSE